MGSQRFRHNWATSLHASVWVLSFTIMVAIKNSSLGLVEQKGLDIPWKAQFLENSLFGKTWTLTYPRAYSLQISCLFPRAFVKNNWQQSFNITWPEMVKTVGADKLTNELRREIYSFKSSLVVQTVKSMSAVQKTYVGSLGWEDPMEKEMATMPVFLPGKLHGWSSLTCYI